MSKVFGSLTRKVADRRFGRITHEEWLVWSQRAKGRFPRFIAEVELNNGDRISVDIYHKSFLVAAGTAAVLFQIGLPGINGRTIKAIRLVSEDGTQSRHLTPSRTQVVETVGAP